jgi:predicted DNA-binding transcriptional regulator AlpA
MKFLTFENLKEQRGWPYSKSHTWRLIRAGKFPKPKKFNGPNSKNLWPEDEIEAAIKSLLSGQSS